MQALTTSAQFTCGDNIIDARDNHVYKTVQIGNQCWIAENISVGTMVNSSVGGQEMFDNSVMEKYCWNNSSINCDNDASHPGGYYEWPEAVQYYSGQPTEPTQGVCPLDWHIPSKSEFETLVSTLGGASVAGGKLKKGGSSGFDAVLSGWRCAQSGGSFFDIYPFLSPPAAIAFYYSSTKSATTPYFLTINANDATTAIQTQYSEFLGFNIRCIRDANVGTSELINKQERFNVNYINVDENSMKININSSQAGIIKLDLMDVTGRSLKAENIEINKGDNNTQIDISDLASGLYIVSFQDEDFAVSQKLFIP
ncbi:FISUMP domain-containing protein [Bacteroidota bacterium]